MKHYRKLAVIALSAAVMSVLLAACSASESPASRTLSTQASAPTAVAARASTTMESQQGAPGQPALAATSAPAPANVYSSSASPTGEGTRTLTVQLYDLDSGNRIGGTANVNDAPYDATFFKHYGVNPFIDTEDDQLSTFAMDVDTASYTIARRFVMDGYLPDPDSVRVEEFVNYLPYEYSAPKSGPFAVSFEGAPSPFHPDREIIRFMVPELDRLNQVCRLNYQILTINHRTGAFEEFQSEHDIHLLTPVHYRHLLTTSGFQILGEFPQVRSGDPLTTDDWFATYLVE